MAAKLLLTELTLQFGATGRDNRLSIELTPLTVFVGPNNSGKSLLLRELSLQLPPRFADTPARILQDVESRRLVRAEVLALFDKWRNGVERDPTVLRAARYHPAGGRERQVDARVSDIDYHLTRKDWLLQCMGLETVFLDGETRLNICTARQAGDLQNPPDNILQAMLSEDSVRATIRRHVYEAFGSYLVVDPTHLGQLRLRMSSRPPHDIAEERGIDARATAFHAAATPIQEMSDGVKAFVGIVLSVIVGQSAIVIVDEPEAFLHPPLIRRLGQLLATQSARRNGNAFVATHSAEFVHGAVLAGVPVQIVRLTYESGVPKANLLESSVLTTLMRDPLLRSAGVLSALFHRGAIVAEGDSDRAFYQEISDRLNSSDGTGVVDGVFLNANGKQNIHRMLGPLRRLGIPTAAVVDLDLLKRTGDVFATLMAAASVPSGLRVSLGMLKGKVEEAFHRDGRKPGEAGIEMLSAREDRESAQQLLELLAQYGVFLVPGGRLESWLAGIGADRDKSHWLSSVFSKMGSDPQTEDYVRPGSDDVWMFVRRIANWLRDPDRRGMSVNTDPDRTQVSYSNDENEAGEVTEPPGRDA